MNTTTAAPADLASAALALAASTGLSLEELAMITRAARARLLADPEVQAVAQANTAGDFYDWLGKGCGTATLRDAIVLAGEDVRALRATITLEDLADRGLYERLSA